MNREMVSKEGRCPELKGKEWNNALSGLHKERFGGSGQSE